LFNFNDRHIVFRKGYLFRKAKVRSLSFNDIDAITIKWEYFFSKSYATGWRCRGVLLTNKGEFLPFTNSFGEQNPVDSDRNEGLNNMLDLVKDFANFAEINFIPNYKKVNKIRYKGTENYELIYTTSKQRSNKILRKWGIFLIISIVVLPIIIFIFWALSVL